MSDVASPSAVDSADVKTLWVGDIEQWMDENYILNMFSHVDDVVNVKLIRDKATMIPSGYGFVELSSHASAQKILETYNGTPIPNSGRSFRLNWASFGVSDKRQTGTTATTTSSPAITSPTTNSLPVGGVEYSVFVGDLSADVTDVMLQNTFSQRYPSVRNAKVVCDPASGLSRGYGFVRFIDENEKNRAMTEMHGQYCGTRPMRISGATPKKSGTTTSTPPVTLASPPNVPVASTQAVDQNDPTNTTIFVGGLDPNVDEDTLRNTFSPFGELIYVKIPASKGCGFVQYVHRQCAENAFSVHGTYIGNQRVRLSWGRSPMAKPASSTTTTTPPSTATPSTTTATSAYTANSATAAGYYPYYNSATGAYSYDSSYYNSAYYGAYAPQKDRVIDFTLPPDINEMNEEYMEVRTEQFTMPWFSRAYNGIVSEPDGPDPLVVSSS